MPNNKEQEEPMVSEIDSDLEEDNSYEFQDKVLVCLRELELLITTTEKNVERMQDSIKGLRAFIHGEDIDHYKCESKNAK